MHENNMYDAIYCIYNELVSRLEEQGVAKDTINLIMGDLIKSINRNIKWTLRGFDGKEIPIGSQTDKEV